MKKALLASALLMLASAAGAAADKTSDDIKEGIADVVKRYANAVACPGVRVRPADVLTLVPYKRGERQQARYAVLWTGDPGCVAGPGDEATYIAIATISGGRFVVDPRLSSPMVSFESPVRFVRRVVDYTEDSLILQGNIYGPQDPHDKPSIPVRFTLQVDEQGNWKMVEKRVLPLGTVGG
jgi:hypothetical protein